jgi:sec-independent protein translocase protein TatC
MAWVDEVEEMGDRAMPFGDHLEELRRRLISLLIVGGGVLLAALIFQSELKLLVVQPLLQAIAMLEADRPGMAAQLGLDISGSGRVLINSTLAEGTLTTLTVAIYASVAVLVPYIIWHIWAFIAPGLRRQERRIVYFFLPGALAFFYGGLALGYYIGLPYLYRFLIEFAHDQNPIASFQLRETDYLGFFAMMTLCFGLIMDIPWGVLLVCRLGLVQPATLAKHRKLVVMGVVLAAAIITPTSDPISLMAVAIPMQLLFESGLLAARLLPGNRRAAADDEI